MPTNANSYLELDVHNPDKTYKAGRAWIFTVNGWVRTDLLHITLVKVDHTHSLLSWTADVSNVDWMNAAYQHQPWGQINSLNADNLRDQHFTEQVLVRPVAGQRYAVYASLPKGTVSDMRCMAPNGLNPFLSL